MGSVRQLQCFLFLTYLLPAASLIALKMSRPGCPSKCGNVTIPYPFGMGTYCSRYGFELRCDESTTPPRVLLGSEEESSIVLKDIKLISINITSGEARAYMSMFYECRWHNNRYTDNYNRIPVNLIFYPTFLFSDRRNKFTAIGCNSLAYVGVVGEQISMSGCISSCPGSDYTTGVGGPCNGLGCCETAIPAGLRYYGVLWKPQSNITSLWNPCSYFMLVEEGWYRFHIRDLRGLDFYKRNRNGVPVVLDWAIRGNGTCQHGLEINQNLACLSDHSTCHNTTNGKGYICKCLRGYQGNPYLRGGCIGTRSSLNSLTWIKNSVS